MNLKYPNDWTHNYPNLKRFELKIDLNLKLKMKYHKDVREKARKENEGSHYTRDPKGFNSWKLDGQSKFVHESSYQLKLEDSSEI